MRSDKLGLDVWEVTDHSSVDCARVMAKAQRVFDTRDATKNLSENCEKLRKLRQIPGR